MPKVKFKPNAPEELEKAESRNNFDTQSFSIFPGEKDQLIEAINEVDHTFTSYSQLNRDAMNKWLEQHGSDFRLTIR